jgi:hypothetical protein
MSVSPKTRRPAPVEHAWPTHSLSEEASHREHHAALEATLFERRDAADEVVFELESGELRLQKSLS